VCLLNAYINGEHERQIRDVLLKEMPNTPVSISSEVRCSAATLVCSTKSFGVHHKRLPTITPLFLPALLVHLPWRLTLPTHVDRCYRKCTSMSER
jgi:hypothetical protein